MGTSFSPAAQKALWSLQLGLQSLVGIMGKLKPHQQPSDCSAKGSRTWVPYSSPINSLWAALLKAAKPRKHHLMTHLNTPLPPCSFSKDPLLRRLWSDQSLTPLYQFCFSFTLMIFFLSSEGLWSYTVFSETHPGLCRWSPIHDDSPEGLGFSFFVIYFGYFFNFLKL